MKLSFKRYLLKEGGKATEEWGTVRAHKKDVKAAVAKVAEILGIPEQELAKSLLGTSRLTYQNKKSSSGDIDIAIDSKNFPKYNDLMLQAVDGRGQYNTGTKVGSYAVEVNGKKVQVDLMFVASPEFAKFMYYSTEGENSKYPGAVRNIMLMTLTAATLEDGKDFVIKDGEEVIARASRSLKLDTGLERLFKVAKMRKDGKGRTKSLEKVHPDELDVELKSIDREKIGSYHKSPDVINNPDKIAEFLFGAGVKGEDIMTAEQVAKLINTKFKGDKLKDVKSNIIKQLEKAEFPVPQEL